MPFKTRNYFRDIPLAHKIAIPFSVLIIIIAIFINLSFPARRESLAKQEMMQQIESLGKICDRAISPALFLRDSRSIENGLRNFEYIEGLLYIVAADSADNIAGALNRQNAIRSNYRVIGKNFDDGQKILKVVRPVYFEGTRIGRIYFGVSTTSLSAELDNIRMTVFVISGIIILLGVGIIVVASQLITKPLRNIAATASAIARGEPGMRAEAKSGDEVGDLARAFNVMVHNLESAYNDLSELNKSLESKILERTINLQDEIEGHKRTEAALRQSQRQLLREQNIFIGGPTVVFRINIAGGFIFEYVSANIDQFGYAAEEILRDKYSIFSLMSPQETARIRKEFDTAILAQTQNFESAFVMPGRNKEPRNIYIFCKVIRDSERAAAHIDGYLIDITTGKKAEIALIESELRFKAIFENAGIGIATIASDGSLLEVNTAFQQITGFPQRDLQTMKFQSFIHPDDIEFTIQDGKSDKRRHVLNPGTHEKRILHKSGKVVWTRITSRTIHSTETSSVFEVAMVEDITTVKQTEKLAADQNLLLRNSADALHILLSGEEFDAVISQVLARLGISTKVDRVILYQMYSDGGANIIARNRCEWKKNFEPPPQKNSALLELRLSSDLPAWLERFSRKDVVSGAPGSFGDIEAAPLLADKVAYSYMVPLYERQTLWGVLRFDDCTAADDWDDNRKSFVHTVADSIEAHLSRERARAELIAVTGRALESDRLKSALLTNMSHEFRTPMNGILGYAEMLSELLQDPELSLMAQSITSSGKRLMRTIESVLDLAQLESGDLPVKILPAELRDIIAPLCDEAQAEAEFKELSFETLFPEELVPALVDASLLRKALTHVLNNAVRFTNIGGIKVRLERSFLMDDAEYTAISVSDTGIGIPLEQQEIIFKEFRQASEGMGRGYEGSGLGLAVAKRMIDLMSGKILVESELGIGSTFTLLLPSATPQPPARVPEETDKAKQGPGTDRAFRVLIVEDNPANADITRLFLRKKYTCDIALNGQEGLAMARLQRFDILLIDINLGTDIDGIMTLKMMREIPGYASTPAIALTGYAMAGDRENILSNGFNFYLPKPFDKKNILALLENILFKNADA